MKLGIACLFFLLLQFNVNAQLGEPIIPYSQLDTQAIFLMKKLLETRRRHIQDTTIANYQIINDRGLKVIFIFSKDSIWFNNTIIRQKNRRSNSRKLSFSNLYFPYPVIICGPDIDEDIEFKNCFFEKAIRILGSIKKSISFERNIMREFFQVGDSREEYVKKGADTIVRTFTFRHNQVLKHFSICNVNFKDTVCFFDNYFTEFELAGCRFFNQFESRSNLNGSLILRFIKCESDFSIADSKVEGRYRINNCSFRKEMKMTNCLLQSPKEEFYATIYQCVFKNAFNLSGSSIKNTRILNCFFYKDSSSLILDHSELNSFELESTTLPYLIDLSNAKISDSGQANFKKIEVGSRDDFELDSTVNWVDQNSSCYLYLDNVQLKNIHFGYEKFILASVYYDPGIHPKTKDRFYDITPLSTYKLKGVGPFSGVEKTMSRIGLGIVEQPGFTPPFSSVVWEKKSRSGIKAKESLYKLLLKKFEDENDSESYSKLDKEFYRFKLLEQNSGSFNTISYYIGKLWWDFGYQKSRIFLWAIILFVFFSIINNFFIFFLNHKIYEIDNITWRLKVVKRLNRRKVRQLNNNQDIDIYNVTVKSKIRFIRYFYSLYFKILSAYKLAQVRTNTYYNNLLLSFIYTGIVFFGFKIDIDKFHLKWSLGTLWVLSIYTTGIICLAFIAKVIIN